VNDVARGEIANPVRRSGHDDVARKELIHGGCPDDQISNVDDELASVRGLPPAPVGEEFEIEVVGVVDFIGGDQPRPKDE
jgi:hypothetical protein